MPFRHPFFIAYSSGTTGKPKCIVHCGGVRPPLPPNSNPGAAILTHHQGSILNAKKEHLLHHRVDPACTYLQYTTTGWIMYLVQVNTLAAGAHLVLYDGSPFSPTPDAFIKVMGDLRVTHLGSSPKYFSELQTRNISPRKLVDLSNLRMVTSTGMVMSAANFSWFYDHGFPAHTQISNMTGGTDTNAAIALGNPVTPVYSGECHGLNTGMAGGVYELVDTLEGPVVGKHCEVGEPGELVITKAFPTMPVKFWGPQGNEQYFNSYFAKYDSTSPLPNHRPV